MEHAPALFGLRTPSFGHNACTDAKMIPDTFKEYFCNEGAVTWQ